MTALTVPDSPKMLRETLCTMQALLGLATPPVSRAAEHMQRLQRLIDECDRHRPLGPDGKHGDRHTATCGCEDAPPTTQEPNTEGRAMTGRWPDATVEHVADLLVAKAAFADWTGGERDGLPTGDHLLAHLTRTRWEAIARNVLAALADAGLLLPAGGKTRTEWGVRYPNLHPEPVYVTDEEMARHVVATVEGSVAFRRTVHTGPWLPVDQSGEHRG